MKQVQITYKNPQKDWTEEFAKQRVINSLNDLTGLEWEDKGHLISFNRIIEGVETVAKIGAIQAAISDVGIFAIGYYDKNITLIPRAFRKDGSWTKISVILTNIQTIEIIGV